MLFRNSLKCPRAKSANHCLTELFSIYQNKHLNIRRRDDHIVVPSSNRIKLKIDLFVQLQRDAERKTNGLDVSLFFQERASMQTPNKIRVVRNFTDVDTNIICLIRNILVVNPSFHLGQLNLLKSHIETGSKPKEIKTVEFS